MSSANFGRLPFKLDAGAPLRRQQGEPERAYNQFWAWKDSGWSDDFTEIAEILDLKPESIDRVNRKYQWKKRRDLDITRRAKPLAEQLYPDEVVTKPRARKTAKGPAAPQAINSDLLPAPEPIERGLMRFAMKYGRVICPGWTLDPVIELMLEKLELVVEGDAGGRLLINPPPRSSKTSCCILALVYSLLRYPDRGQALISANGRLASLNNQLMKTLFEAACPEGYGISKDSKSKLAWKPNWQGAREQLALSRGGALLGFTISGLAIADDLCAQTSDIESPDIMSATMRTLGTDVTTRLTKDAAGKGAALVVVAQRLGATDPTAELINRARQQERDGLIPLKFDVIASPFINPSKERQAEINATYPASWRVFQPRYGKEGECVSQRFDQPFLERLRSEVAEADFEAMYLLNTEQTAGWCQWKPTYIKEIDPDEIKVGATMMAIDFGLTEGGDRSALTVGGVMDGHVVILGLHFLEGQIEEMFAQIVDIAKTYNVHTVGIEMAAAGDFIFRGLNNNIGDRHFNLVKLSHGGKNKGMRQSAMLGWASNGKLLAAKGQPLMTTLQDQMRVIATQKGRGHKADDLADSCVHMCNFIWERWVKSGFGSSSVTWGDSAASGGGTPCLWGRGSHALMKPSLAIDGEQHYRSW